MQLSGLYNFLQMRISQNAVSLYRDNAKGGKNSFLPPFRLLFWFSFSSLVDPEDDYTANAEQSKAIYVPDACSSGAWQLLSIFYCERICDGLPEIICCCSNI